MNNRHPFPITNNAKPIARILCPKEALRAAGILADNIEKMTGARLNIETIADTEDELFDNPAEEFAETTPFAILFIKSTSDGPEGFSYRVMAPNQQEIHAALSPVLHTGSTTLLIHAATEQSFVHAVYDLLEQGAGCRWYTSTESLLPRSPSLSLNVPTRTCQPPLQYREVYYRDFTDRTFAEKHKMAPSGVHEGWGFWCHSFGQLLPNGEHFLTHPEWFALIDGERNPKGEPCLSHPEVFTHMRDNLARFMLEKPECRIWSVSQNDDNLYCRCPECARQDALDGGPMGSLLTFVNRIAEAFPDKIISTLAYWYSRKAPRVTRPARNVHIMLCNIEALRGMPIETDPHNEGTRQELLEWEAICGNLSLWDYCIQFANLVSPFPNLRVIAPNLRFFTDHHVTMLFSQANREIGGEWSELRGYLLAKLMWEPHLDPRHVMEDFCTGYYGPAAPFLLHYIDRVHDAMEASGGHLNIFEGPLNEQDTFLTESLHREYEADFTRAEEAVRDAAPYWYRVRRARMPIDYAGIVLGYGSREERLARIHRFKELAHANGVKMVEEWKITVDQFVADSLASLPEA